VDELEKEEVARLKEAEWRQAEALRQARAEEDHVAYMNALREKQPWALERQARAHKQSATWLEQNTAQLKGKLDVFFEQVCERANFARFI
jgi:hypothetical protein